MRSTAGGWLSPLARGFNRRSLAICCHWSEESIKEGVIQKRVKGEPIASSMWARFSRGGCLRKPVG